MFYLLLLLRLILTAEAFFFSLFSQKTSFSHLCIEKTQYYSIRESTAATSNKYRHMKKIILHKLFISSEWLYLGKKVPVPKATTYLIFPPIWTTEQLYQRNTDSKIRMLGSSASIVPKMSLATLGTGNRVAQSSARCHNKADISHLPFHVYDSCKGTQKQECKLTAMTYFVFVSFAQQRILSSIIHSLGFFCKFYSLLNSSTTLKQQNELNESIIS